jgi:hypothetical protein
MSNPTTPFSWQMPTATDLVTDLPADFEVFGQAVATSMADLLGGTSGQILAKNSNTDMDFVWIANDQGDITGITASSPLTGGGTSGAITVGIQDALTTQKGAVQLSDSTSTTSSILAATPTAVKAAYDLADGAIAKTTVTTAGDIIYRNATVPVRLGIGTAGQVLTVNTGATAPEWKTPSSGSTFSGAFVKKSANQTITTSLDTFVTFDEEEYDTDAYHSNVTNNTRFTIPSGKSGYYAVTAGIRWNTNGTGRRIIYFAKNGYTNIDPTFELVAGASGAITSVGYAMRYFTAGDYIECGSFQTSGGNLDILSTLNGSTFFQIQYLGA